MKNIKKKRSFIPGDEWVYFKFYCGVKTADEILLKVVTPITELLLYNNQIDKWFFIRYFDTDLHIRFRLHLTEKNHLGSLISIVHSHILKYVSNSLVWNVQIDTYNRELERYGNLTIELSEELFYLDSNLFIKALPYFNKRNGDVQRWIMALKIIDLILNSFNYSIKEKAELLMILKNDFYEEFGMNKILKSQLDTKYRKERRTIEQTLCFPNSNENLTVELLDHIKEYSTLINPIIRKIITIRNNNQLEVSVNSLIASYIHMSMNRMFISHQRIHELVLYDFLFRHYKSVIAKHSN